MVERPAAPNPADLNRLEIHQASGMLAAQGGISVDVALHWLIEYAARTHREVIDVARDVINRQLTLSPASD